MNSQKAQSRTPRVVPRQSRIVASDSVLRGRGVVPGTKSQMAYGAASASRCCIKENCLLYVVKTIKGGKFYGKDKEQRKRRPKDKTARFLRAVYGAGRGAGRAAQHTGATPETTLSTPCTHPSLRRSTSAAAPTLRTTPTPSCRSSCVCRAGCCASS